MPKDYRLKVFNFGQIEGIKAVNIAGKKVVLRAIEQKDAELLHRWANDPEIGYLLGGWHFPGSISYTTQWIESLARDTLNQRFAIEVPDLGLIGTANIVDIDWKNSHASYGIMLGDKDFRGKGYGIDTIMAVMRYSFEELHFERLDTTIIEYNQPSYNIHTLKCGWKEEGRQRNWYFRKNRYWDRIIVGVTRQDYFDLVAKNNYWGDQGN